MLATRQSDAVAPNPDIKEFKAEPRENNQQWLARLRSTDAKATDGVILMGGATLSHFRMRVAQSHVRGNLLPSCWSLAGLMVDDERFLTVPLAFGGKTSDVPQSNGVQACPVEDYKNPKQFPNIAVLRFVDNPEFIFSGPDQDPPERSIVENIKSQRGIIDLPAMLLAWLAYIWGVGQRGNPLLDGAGIPSAVFAETAYGIGGIEMTPGLSSTSSCPEAIWHAAKWWHGFYRETLKLTADSPVKGIVPTGYYMIRQEAAAANWPPANT